VAIFGDFWRNFLLNRGFVTGYSFFKIFLQNGENSLPRNDEEEILLV
jgi:hypothetical protein